MHPENVCNRLPDNQLVGLVVGLMPEGNFHAGITFRWRGDLFLYHQAFHFITRLEPFDAAIADLGGQCLVVELKLRPDRQRTVAGFLNDMGKKNPQFPYAMKHDPKLRIDINLGRLMTDEGVGLSCVTFVLAVLNSTRIRLVDSTTWPKDRPADLTAQEKLVEMLKGFKHPAPSPQHIQAVEAEKGCLRIRPEELGGSGFYLKWPVAFPEAEVASLSLLGQIAKLAGRKGWQLYPEAH